MDCESPNGAGPSLFNCNLLTPILIFSMLDTMLKTILSLISLAVSCAGALVGYFFTIHALGNEGHAPIVSLLCGATIWTTVRFGVDALGDA